MRKAAKSSLRSDAERNELVERWLYLPAWVFQRMRHVPRVPLLGREEAVACGNLALIRAAELWDASKGFAFSTFAAKSIYYSLIDASLRDRVIKVPDYRHRSYSHLSPELKQLSDNAKNIVQLSELRNRFQSNDESMEERAGWDFDDYRSQVCTLEEDEEMLALRRATARLSLQDQDVVRRRFLSDPRETLATIAAEYSVTREAIRLRVKRILVKLRAAMTADQHAMRRGA